MSWTHISFGKHKSKTLPQVIWTDPDWFFWAIANNVFSGKGNLEQEASDLARKSAHIRIPNNKNNDLVIEYVVDQITGKFSHFDVVKSSKPIHLGSSTTSRLSVLDFGEPRRLGRYDKLGYRLFVASAKFFIFGTKDYRLTKGRCEKFFDDPANFVLDE